MKTAFVTRADAGIEEMTDITHGPIKALARKCGSDLIILDGEKWEVSRHYRIMECYNLLSSYNRILSIDSDVLVLPSCPNPFDEVPEECIGTVYEDKGSRQWKRARVLKSIQERYGKVSQPKGYMNTGFAVFSHCHRDVFQKIKNEYWDGWGFDDAHLWWQAHSRKMKFFELPFQFNHMTMFSEGWNGSPNRFDSHVIHYAGVGKFSPCKSRVHQIKKDFEFVYG